MTDENICCICMEMKNDDQKIVKLNCNHEYHFLCYSTYCFTKNEISKCVLDCPLCKDVIIQISDEDDESPTTEAQIVPVIINNNTPNQQSKYIEVFKRCSIALVTIMCISSMYYTIQYYIIE